MSHNRVPIKFSSGTTIGPVTVVCVTITILAFCAMFVLLALYGNEDKISMWVRPLIPVLATIGSVALVYAKAHSVGRQSSVQNEAIIHKADDVLAKADDVKDTVEHNSEQLNGSLQGKINRAVMQALKDHEQQKGNDHG